jgi:hypothetical protein
MRVSPSLLGRIASGAAGAAIRQARWAVVIARWMA